MFCNKCGNQIQPGSTFCPKCGNPINGAVNNMQPVQPVAPAPAKKRTWLKVLLIIAIILVSIGVLIAILFATVFSTIFTAVNNSDNKIVCSASVGSITLLFDDENLIGYTTTGDLTFDLSEQKKIAKKIGVSEYKKEFNEWFIDNTNGTCKDNGTKMEDTRKKQVVEDTDDKLACTSSQGDITLSFKDGELDSYLTTGLITFDLDEQKGVALIKGEDEYKKEFNKWFINNTDGKCLDNGVEIVEEQEETIEEIPMIG